MKKNKEYKQPVPEEFVPTELGSAVFANVSGRPTDEEYMEQNTKSQKGKNDPPVVGNGVFPFVPARAFFEEEAMEYPVGRRIYDILNEMGIEIKSTGSHNRVTGIPGKTAREAYQQGKRTLVVGVRKTLDFQTCKPSAHFQLPLVTGCPGQCQYCYLNTTMGKKPYIRVYVPGIY